MPKPPTKIGPFYVDEILEATYTSVVYKGHRKRPKQTVAIKVCAAKGKSSEDQRWITKSFTNEIQHLEAILPHPNLVTKIAHYKYKGQDVLVTPFYNGFELSNRESEIIPLDQAIQIIKEVAAAADWLHRHQIVHRDIKTENIFVNQNGTILADLGLAINFNESGSESDSIYGTPCNMSPEQALGKQLDQRSDIFLLGLVLYEILTGINPFKRETAVNCLIAVTRFKPQPPAHYNSDVPDALAKVIYKCLAKKPHQRYQTVPHFIQALEEAMIAPTYSVIKTPWWVSITHWLKSAMPFVAN